MVQQVTSLTNTVAGFREQLNVNNEFAASAANQVREETQSRFETTQARIEEVAQQIPTVQARDASNAGGDRALSSTDTPLVNKFGKSPHVNDSEMTCLTIECAFCQGDVPNGIAKHCIDSRTLPWPRRQEAVPTNRL